MATKKTRKAAKGKQAKMVTGVLAKVLLPTHQQQREAAKARASATGQTPTPQALGAGVRLEWPYKGTVHKAVVEKTGEGEFVLRVGKQFFRSLSQAAQSISGHAQRGGICWRREGETQPLLGRVSYAAAGASPAPKKPKATRKNALQVMAEREAAKAATKARKPRRGNGKAGTLKVTKGVRCAMKGCGQMIAATDLAAHMATHAPE